MHPRGHSEAAVFQLCCCCNSHVTLIKKLWREREKGVLRKDSGVFCVYQRGFPSTADRRCNSAMVFLGRGGQPVVGRETRPENRVKSSDIDSVVDVVARSAGQQHFVAMAFKRKFGDQEREADKTSLIRKRFLFCCPCCCSDLVCPTALIFFLKKKNLLKMKNAFNLAGSRTDPNMMSIEHVERRMRPVRSSACRNYVHGTLTTGHSYVRACGAETTRPVDKRGSVLRDGIDRYYRPRCYLPVSFAHTHTGSLCTRNFLTRSKLIFLSGWRWNKTDRARRLKFANESKTWH